MVEVFDSELARRQRAIELVNSGVAKAETARRVGRSRRWVIKWVARWDADGAAGLVDRPRVPHTQPTKTSQRVVNEVLKMRARLEAIPEANIGGLSVLAAMERQRFEPLPSVATIERILSDAGVTRPTGKRDRRSGVSLPLPKVTAPGIWQQADWIQDRYLEGGIRFQSLQIADVGSHGIASGQYLDRKLLTAVTFVIEHAWPTLSIPAAMGIDNAFVKTSHPNNPFTVWTRICLWFGVEVIVSPPGSHGWTNHIEAVNHQWQRATIWAQHFTSLEDLRAGSDRACWWLNHHRAILNPDTHGTRYPAEYIANHTHQLTWPPAITIADHLDKKGHLTIPLAAGRITYLRYVTEHHTIEVANTTWPVPPTISTGGLVTATITTQDHALTITHHGEPAATYNYPIKHPIANPYHPPTEHSLLHHV